MRFGCQAPPPLGVKPAQGQLMGDSTQRVAGPPISDIRPPAPASWRVCSLVCATSRLRRPPAKVDVRLACGSFDAATRDSNREEPVLGIPAEVLLPEQMPVSNATRDTEQGHGEQHRAGLDPLRPSSLEAGVTEPDKSSFLRWALASAARLILVTRPAAPSAWQRSLARRGQHPPTPTAASRSAAARAAKASSH